MPIDWFTVGAQALNFVILVWLMKHFLYGPILHAIDAREQRIAAKIADADAKNSDAQMERAEFRNKNEEFDQQRAVRLSQAIDEVSAERQRLLDEAKKADEALKAKRQETLNNDARDLSLAIARQTREEVFAIARKALTDLASTSLEERMIDVFTRRLREMDNQAKARLGTALMAASDPALVRSAFDLSTQQRTAIQQALNEAFSGEVHVRFEAASDLIGGIEFVTTGHKVAWSIDDYIGSLEKGVAALLAKRVQPEQEIKSEPAPVRTEGEKGDGDEHNP